MDLGAPSQNLSIPAFQCCSAPLLHPLFEARPDNSAEKFSVGRCENCRLTYLSPPPTAEQLVEHYQAEYFGQGDAKFDPSTERIVAGFLWWRCQVLSQYLPRGGRVLDVGCGRGNFVEAMQKRGFDAYGTEIDSCSARRSQSRLGGRIHVGDLENLDLPASSFDLIVIWHVLEHVRNPRTTLEAAYRLLKPSGQLVTAQPNIASWQAQMGRELWFHLDCPRHLFHFSPDTLAALLRNCKFEPQATSHLSIEQNPFGWLQTSLNCLGIPQNLLYQLLKNNESNLPTWQKFLLRSIYIGGMPLAILVSLIETAFLRGGTFYIRASKREE